MIVRITILILALLMAHDFECTVGNHLVGIHIDRCSGATLHHVDRKVFMEFTIYDFLTGLTDSAGNLVIDDTKRVISLHGS